METLGFFVINATELAVIAIFANKRAKVTPTFGV